MRLSTRFKLGVSQHQLDFVDIDPNKDIRLFVDPHFLGRRSDRWSTQAAASIQGFFSVFLELLKAGKDTEARALFSHLGEPNDTCLGMSKGKPKGSGVGPKLADEMFESLVTSKAAKTGLLSDIEDARIFVAGIDKDRVSDMSTMLIRAQLLEYTRDQCDAWDIPLTSNVPSGDVWDVSRKTWTSFLTDRLVVAGRPLLLVPKGIVSYSNRYTAGKFHQHYVLTYLKNEHLRLNTALVQRRRRRDGTERRWVTKKRVKEHEAPLEKDYLAEFTARHPEVFADFKAAAIEYSESLSNEELTSVPLTSVVKHLLDSLSATPAGKEHADAYHRLSMGILELCFYPSLITPKREVKLHNGRKRVDITFDNAAESGFFQRLHAVQQIPSQYVMVECKNYSRSVANPEFDQLIGRFGVNRGKFGMLMSRTTDDLPLMLERCSDAYKDGHGLMIPLVDDDLRLMLNERLGGNERPFEALLSDRMRLIAMQ